jgi:hypothetical protein
MPCWIIASKKLGIELPEMSEEEGFEIEKEIMLELNADTHEELMAIIEKLLNNNPEYLEEIIRNAIMKILRGKKRKISKLTT